VPRIKIEIPPQLGDSGIIPQIIPTRKTNKSSKYKLTSASTTPSSQPRWHKLKWLIKTIYSCFDLYADKK